MAHLFSKTFDTFWTSELENNVSTTIDKIIETEAPAFNDFIVILCFLNISVLKSSIFLHDNKGKY